MQPFFTVSDIIKAIWGNTYKLFLNGHAEDKSFTNQLEFE